MKQAIKLFWKGLTGILSALANWITTILGMNDESKYGKVLRRIVGTCFATLALVLTITVLSAWGYNIYRECSWRWCKYDDNESYNNQFVSRNIYFHDDYGSTDGYIFDRNGKKLIKGVQWISKPLGEDSLVVYSDGKKRGYFNMYTGEVVIKPTYDHAWVFSDGLASVDIDGCIKFIDTKGNIAFDPHLAFHPDMEGYVFHNNLCIVENDKGDRQGLINKQGEFVLAPEYIYIDIADSLYVISKGEEQSVINAKLQTILPFMRARLIAHTDVIEAIMDDHNIRNYNRQGELINGFYITETSQLRYDTDEIHYSTSYEYDEDGNITSKSDEGEQSVRQAIAHCLRYQAEYEWYGLMSKSGKVITPPSYSSIEAIGPDLYLCSDNHGNGIILNGKGEIIK